MHDHTVRRVCAYLAKACTVDIVGSSAHSACSINTSVFA